MTTKIAPSKKMTFTIKKTPRSEGDFKTIQRLMGMQPDVQRARRKLSKQRRQYRNKLTQRGGRVWIVRESPSKVVLVKPGESFTLNVTPQIVPDLQRVEKYLDAK